MLARNRAGTIKIILVLFHETSLDTQKKFFAKLFNLWFALTLSRRFTKCLKQCVHICSRRKDTLNYSQAGQPNDNNTFQSILQWAGNEFNIGLEVYSQ